MTQSHTIASPAGMPSQGLSLGVLSLLVLQVGVGLVAATSHWLVVFAPIAAASALIAIFAPRFGLFLLVPLLFLQVDLPGAIGLYPADACALILLAGLGVHALTAPSRTVRSCSVLLPVLLILGVFALSLLWAHDFGAGLRNWLRHVEMFGLIVITATSLNSQEVRRLLRWLLFVTVVMTIPNLIEAVQIGGRQRVFGLAGPYFPFMANVAIIQCLVGFALDTQFWKRILWIVVAAVLSVGVIVTQTREAMVQLAIAAVVIGLLVLSWSKRHQLFAPRRRVAILATLGILLLAVFFSGAIGLFDASANRVTQALEGHSNTIFIRLFLWKTGFQAFLDSPILGMGLGQVGQWHLILPYWRFDPMAMLSKGVGAHNDLITYGSETGIIGLAAIGWLFWRILTAGAQMWRRMRMSSDPAIAIVLLAVVISLISRFVYGTHIFYSIDGLLSCLCFGMLIAYARSVTQEGDLQFRNT